MFILIVSISNFYFSDFLTFNYLTFVYVFFNSEV